MRRLTTAALLCLLFSPAAAAGPAELFGRAGKEYDAGHFAAAALCYDSLLQMGYTGAAVYFNLGNAYFRAGDLGRAIWAYRAGKRQAPRDSDIDANLTVARLAARDRIEAVPPGLIRQMWRSVGNLLSLREGAWLVTVSWLLLWFLVTGWFFYRRLRKWIAPLIKLTLTVWCLAALVLMVRYLELRNTQVAVVVAPETVARSGPGAEFDSVFSGHSGLECVVRGQKNGFVLVELVNGRVGWVTQQDILLVPS